MYFQWSIWRSWRFGPSSVEIFELGENGNEMARAGLRASYYSYKATATFNFLFGDMDPHKATYSNPFQAEIKDKTKLLFYKAAMMIPGNKWKFWKDMVVLLKNGTPREEILQKVELEALVT